MFESRKVFSSSYLPVGGNFACCHIQCPADVTTLLEDGVE